MLRTEIKALSLGRVAKSEPSCYFCTSGSSCLPPSCLSVVCVNLGLPKGCLVSLPCALPVCPCECVCLWKVWCVSVSVTAPNNRFTLYLLTITHRKTPHGEGMRGTSKKPWPEFYKGIYYWLQLIPTDPDNKHHCLSSNIHILCSIFIVDIHFIRLFLTSIFAPFSKHLSEHTHVHKLILQLYTNLGCKWWLHTHANPRPARSIVTLFS